MSEFAFPRGLRVEQHVHPWGYACLTLAGSVQDTLAGRTTTAVPGYWCFVPPDWPHSNEFGAVGARCLVFEVEPDVLDGLSRAGVDVGDARHGFGGGTCWRGLQLYELVHRGEASALDVDEFLCSAADRNGGAAGSGGRPPAWLSRVRDMLDASVAVPPVLAQLAAEAGVHPMHLVRTFRAHHGTSPGEFLQARRVVHACRLLLTTDASLAQVALALGYHDQSHFSRVFKARLGVTPGRYRSRAGGTRGEPAGSGVAGKGAEHANA